MCDWKMPPTSAAKSLKKSIMIPNMPALTTMKTTGSALDNR